MSRDGYEASLLATRLVASESPLLALVYERGEMFGLSQRGE